MTEITFGDVERSRRVRAVTDNLFFWQGLRFVALGPAVMLVALTKAQPEISDPWSTAVLALGIAISLAGAAWFGGRYRAMGKVVGIPGAHRRRSRLKWFLVYPLMIGAAVVDLFLPLPLMVTPPVWTAALIAYRNSTGGGRDHYLALAGALAGFTFAPLVIELPSVSLFSLFLLILGGGFTAAAWLDHREMQRVLEGA